MNEEKLMVPGFKASAVSAGLKKNGELDLALILSEDAAAAAAVFTTNRVKAAPVLLDLENIKKGRARAILANSGNANACNGEAGMRDARLTVKNISERLGIPPDEVLLASTGVIGQPLQVDLIEASMDELVKGLSPEGVPLAASAIMTTDSFPKSSFFDGVAGGTPYRIAGIAKGAGMIMPDMATMLCFVLSDIDIHPDALREVLGGAARESFNRITVDGDTSTNDMVLVMANGSAGNKPLTDEDLNAFSTGITNVMEELALMMVRDGEGASRSFKVEVKGAASREDAERAARTVANSSLVKTAV